MAEFDFPVREREGERENIPWTLISTWLWWVVVVTGDFSLMMKGRTPQSVIEDKVHPLSLDKTLINPPSRLNRAVAQDPFLEVLGFPNWTEMFAGIVQFSVVA